LFSTAGYKIFHKEEVIELFSF